MPLMKCKLRRASPYRGTTHITKATYDEDRWARLDLLKLYTLRTLIDTADEMQTRASPYRGTTHITKATMKTAGLGSTY